MPTILDLINYHKPFFAFGKTMLSNENWAINFLQNEYRLITDNSIIINNGENYSSFSDFNTSNSNELSYNETQLLKAIKQDYNYRILNNKLFNEN